MFNKRQVFFGAIALTLTTFLLTAGAFMYFFHLVSGDAPSTVKFFRALRLIQKGYIGDAPSAKLFDGAIGGLVRSLDDPHSMYMSGEVFNQFMMATEGQFGGIGVIVGGKDGALTVVAPIEGTPGEAAGIKSGDRIVKIDGEETRNMPLDIAVGKIRGFKDTFVELELLTANNEERTMKIMRALIKVPTVSGKKIEDKIGYIRVAMFTERTYEEFLAQLGKLEKEGVNGIVLDLRNNPGGLLDASVRLAEHFVPRGPIVSIVDRSGNKKILESANANPKYKVAVLVNGGSASASEIVAGAVQDSKAGLIVGTATYGKASVQSIFSLDGDSAIKLTVAHYYTPAGRGINGVGIKPDVDLPRAENGDNQLDKAVEMLRLQLAGEGARKGDFQP
ncbi:MAG: S41 family peptidase [Acidaminococcales bacterium]|nr:S41 family peptidase [Acidaminococcales bacterium]